MSTHFLLAPRPGWRLAPLLGTGISFDGLVLRLSDGPARSIFDDPLQRAVALSRCERAVLDPDHQAVLIITGTGQLRMIITAPDPAGWSPIGLRALPGDRLAVLDAGRLVHLFDHCGRWLRTVPDLPGTPAVDPAQPYAATGTAVCGPLDSRRPGCRWHRIVLDGDVPGGTQVEVATLTTDLDLTQAEIAALPADRWSVAGTYGDPALTRWDVLIGGPPGQHLWLRIALRGDRTATPRLTAAEVYYPRATSLGRLPAVYAAGPSDFLDRFLALTDTVRDSVVALLDSMPAELDARSADPADRRDFLVWLGGWVGMTGIAELPVVRQRRLIAAAAELYRRRGTPDGVARHVGLWLGRRTAVLEHFRLRRWAVLNRGRLGDATQLWGPGIVGRLQLDEYATMGEFSLVSVPSPRTDPFRVFAHRYTLYVYAHGDDDLAVLERSAAAVVAAVQPAHTAADIALVQACAQIGVQARLGLDAVVAGPPSPGHLGDRLGIPLAADPATSGLSSIGNDARVGSRAVVG